MRRNRSWDTEGKAGKLYGRRWKQARLAFLSANPFCAMCKAQGETRPANVVDHIVPHKGDENLFWDQSNWQALCEPHHNGEKASMEIRGYSDRIGADGWPLDPNHPSNTGRQPVSGKAKPDDILPISVPVFLVVGPPASGKSTWCRQRMQPGDVLIDFDVIDAELNGRARRPGTLYVPILRERNTRLIAAAAMTQGCVFLPTTGARKDDRDWWKRKLGNVVVVLIDTDQATCIERINSDDERKHQAAASIEHAARWFRTVERDGVDLVVSGTGGASDHEIEAERRPAPKSNKDLVSDTYDEIGSDPLHEEFVI